MLYEPCMFIVEIEGRKTYMSVFTDDIDAACEKLADGKAILDKLGDSPSGEAPEYCVVH